MKPHEPKNRDKTSTKKEETKDDKKPNRKKKKRYILTNAGKNSFSGIVMKYTFRNYSVTQNASVILMTS
jgi:hypothetical protein